MSNAAAAKPDAEKGDKTLTTKRKTLPELLADPATNQRFTEMLGKDARSFQQNILTVFNAGQLRNCEPESIIAAAAISASINLSILPSLGHSCIVPYKDKDGSLIAQWQIMWKGLIQLAHRSGQYKKINLARVYDGQLVSYDPFKGTVQLQEKRRSERVQGYYFYFELITGGTFEFYWSAKECIEHGLRYSKSFQAGNGKWTEDEEFTKAGTVKKWLAQPEGQHFLTEGSGADSMSAKTIVKNEVQTWGPLETRIKEIVSFDQAVVAPDGSKRYIDTTAVDEGGAATPKTYTTAKLPDGRDPSPAEKLAWAREASFKQGVSNEQFDAWVAEQPGGDEAKAEAATVAWKKVAAKEAKAVDVFAVTPSGTTKFKVAFVGTSTFNDADAYVIKDDEDPPVKYYTNDAEVFEAAKAAKKDGSVFAVKWTEKKAGDKPFRWITALV